MLFNMKSRKILWPFFGFIIFLAIVATLLSFLLSKSSFVKRQVEQSLENLISSNFNLKAEIAKTEGNILTGYTLSDINFFADDTVKIGSIKSVSIEYNLFALLKRNKTIKRILIKEPGFDFSRRTTKTLLRKKEKKEEGKKEEKPYLFAFENLSIIKGNLILNYSDITYNINNINMEGKLYLSQNKNTIFLKKCNATLPSITDVESITGTINLKKGIVSLLDCSVKTRHSSLFCNGNLFDEKKELSVNIKNLSLKELSKSFWKKKYQLTGGLNGTLQIKGKKENLEVEGMFQASNIIYKDDTLGQISSHLNLKDKKLRIDHLLWKPPYGEVLASGSYNLLSKKVSIKTDVKELILDNMLSKLMKKNWKGKLTGKITVTGSNIDNRMKRELDIKANIVKSFIKNLEIDSLLVDLSYNKKRINLKKIDLYKKGDWIKINGVWAKEKRYYMKSKNFHLSPLLDLIGIKDVDARLTVKGMYEESNGKKLIQANIGCKKLRYKNIKGEYLTATINYNIPGKNSHLLLKDVTFLNNQLDSLIVSVISDTIIRSFSLLSEGKNIHLYTLANLSMENSNLLLGIDTLIIRYRKAEIRNRKRLNIELSNKMMKLNNGSLVFKNRPISISFNIDKKWDYKLSIDSDSLDLRMIAELTKFTKNLGGILGFELTGEGSLRNPELTLNLNVQNFLFEGSSLDKISGDFNYFNDAIHISSLKIAKGEEISEASGTIPLALFRKKKDASQRIEFTLTVNNLGELIFYPLDKFCHYEGGKVYGSIKATGTVGKIVLNGDLRLYATNLYIPLFGLRLKDTDGYIVLAGERVEIKKIKGNVTDGYLESSGSIFLPDKSINISINGNHIPVVGFKDVCITVNPALKLKGSLSNPTILGVLKVENGDITIPFRQKYEKGIRKGNFSYDLEVSAEDGNIWLKNQDVDVELAGKVFAKGTGNAPQLSGSFETKRGFFFYLEHTFDIEKGNFKFTNAPELNPEIELHAQTKVHYTYTPEKDSKLKDTTTIIYLDVEGTMLEPKFRLTAENPSFTEENIILLLTLNVASLEDITSLSNVSTLSNKAASYWIRQTMLREFQSTLGVDAIDLETKLLGPEKSAKLTVGKYISKDLYLGVTHDIFATSKDEFEIEYKVWKGSYIIGERNEEGRYNLGVKFKFKY